MHHQRIFSLFGRRSATFFLCCVAFAASSCNSRRTGTLVLLHTNDEHSHLLGFQPEIDDFPTPASGQGVIKGGIARRATLLASERARVAKMGSKAATLTVSAGDNTMGTLMEVTDFTDASDFVLMKQLGYDVTTWGNHEFDFGPTGLARMMTAAAQHNASVTTVSTNVHFSSTDSGDDSLQALFDETGHDASKPAHRYWVVTAQNGLRVGFVGVLGASAAQFASIKAPVTFSVPASGKESDTAGVIAQIAADIQPVVNRLHDVEDCDVVVALSHSGVSQNDPTSGDDYKLAQNVSGIDVIISGHDHSATPAFTVNNLKTGKSVLIQEASCFGDTLGQVTVTVDQSGAHARIEDAALLAINDTIATDSNTLTVVNQAVANVEATKLPNGASLLETALTHITGSPVVDNSARLGDLYFYPVAQTSFDVVGKGTRVETPIMVLNADGQLAAADLYSGGTTDIALQVTGLIRGDLPKGQTGALSFGDVFRVLPLGFSPVDGSVGDPLVRAALYLPEFKAALEVSASYSYLDEYSDYFMVLGGASYEYDPSRAPFSTSGSAYDPNNGRVTKITLASDHTKPDVFDHVIFDIAQGGFLASLVLQLNIVTDVYVMEFAESFGIQPKMTDGSSAPFASVTDAILRRGDGTEVKDYEALGAYLQLQSQNNGGTLPSRWDVNTVPSPFPQRAICVGPACANP